MENVKGCKCVGNLQGGKWDKINESCKRVYSTEQASPTLHTCGGGNTEIKILENIRIRKLTPRECFRLMGVEDEDFEKIAKNQSDTSLYHLAGDSIITNCLVAIFREMIGEQR